MRTGLKQRGGGRGRAAAPGCSVVVSRQLRVCDGMCGCEHTVSDEADKSMSNTLPPVKD